MSKIAHTIGCIGICGLLLITAANQISNAQPASPGKSDPLPVVFTTDFDLTGNGDESEWSKASWVELTMRKGSQSYQTRMKIMYSEKGIYCMMDCEDKKITATMNEDFADLYKEDVVEIFFWPDESLPVYFEYELSPLNFELAIVVPNIEGNFFGWRPWHYEGDRKTRHATGRKADGTSWVAEVFIPYALLRPLILEAPKPGDQWRANFYRIDYDGERTHWTWKPVEKNFHDYKLYGSIRFEKRGD